MENQMHVKRPVSKDMNNHENGELIGTFMTY